MYCQKCGKELKANASYCHSCGAPVHDTDAEGWSEFSENLGKASLGAAKGIASAPMVGAMIASGLASLGLLITAVYAFYQFAIGNVLMLPGVIAASLPFDTLGGPLLLGAGIAAAVGAVLLALTVHALAKGLKSLHSTTRSK